MVGKAGETRPLHAVLNTISQQNSKRSYQAALLCFTLSDAIAKMTTSHLVDENNRFKKIYEMKNDFRNRPV